MKDCFTRRRCPKCGGNVYLDEDLSCWYEKCLQCGYTRYLEGIAKVQPKAGKGSPRQAG